MFNLPIIFNTDSYKLSHYRGYRPGTTEIYSYGESRGGQYKNIPVVGMSAVVDMLMNFRLTWADVLDMDKFSTLHGVPSNIKGWKRLFEKYGISDTYLTYLPVRIEGLREGTVARPREPLFAVYNTDPEFPWLTSYLETALLRVWYPLTVASRVFSMRQKLKPIFDQTGAISDGFGILDFGSRGATSTESSALAGLGHLASYIGSDNLPAIYLARKVYRSEMPAFSVDATEHSIMTMWEPSRELESFEYLIENMARPNSILSVVSDSWNIFEATKKWGTLKEKLLNKNVKLVVRPDSGEINEVLPEVLESLANSFGTTRNSAGYSVLNGVSALWGDGMNEETIINPYLIARNMDISAESILAGSGGGLLQSNLDRDTLKFAFKASNAVIDGVNVPVAKNPITDRGKSSKTGKFQFDHVYYDNGVFGTPPTLDEIRSDLTAKL